MSDISLLKVKLEKKAPDLLKLAKKANIVLEKVKLEKHRAKVALCLDISGSMSNLYSSKKIQVFAEKILALGCNLDDNGTIDIFLFGSKAHNAGVMNIDNFAHFIQQIQQKHPLEGGTCYGKVMKMIREFYFPHNKGQELQTPFTSSSPVYVMFVTDGAPQDALNAENQLKWSSYEPIFWQFLAIGKSKKDVKQGGLLSWFSQGLASDFSFLESLDDLSGRYLDNADFFSVEDPQLIGDDELYKLLMTEYPNWVKLAQQKQLLS